MPNGFASWLIQQNLAPRTVVEYVREVNQFQAWLLEREGRSLSECSPQHAQAYCLYLSSFPQEVRPGIHRAYASRTVRKKILVLKRFFDYLEKGA
jgi:site-specific recombinase XerD